MDPVQPVCGGERLYPDPETGPYRLRLWFGVVGGRPAVLGVEMWGAAPPGDGWQERSIPDAQIRAADVRLPLGAELDRWVAEQHAYARAALSPGFLAAAAETWPDLELLRPQKEAAFAATRKVAQDYLRTYRKRRAGRPSSIPENLLRTVAEQYQAAVLEGSRAPAEAVAIYFEEIGRPNVNNATVRGWIRKARQRGYLPPSRRRTRGLED